MKKSTFGPHKNDIVERNIHSTNIRLTLYRSLSPEDQDKLTKSIKQRIDANLFAILAGTTRTKIYSKRFQLN